MQYKVQIENQEQAEFVMMSMSQVIWYAVDMEGMPEPGGYKSYLKGMKVEEAE